MNINQTDLPQDNLLPQGNTPVTNGFDTTNGCITPTSSEYLNNDLVDGVDNCNVTDCIYKNTVQTLSDDSVDLLDITKPELPNGTSCDNVKVCVDSVNVIAQESDIGHVQNNIRTVESVDNNYFGGKTSDVVVEHGLSQQFESAFDARRNVISNQKTDMANEKDLNNMANIAKNLCDINGFESICLQSSCDLPAVHSKGDINHNGDIRSDEIDSDTECTEPSESKSENTICDKSVKQELLNSVETSTETLTSEKVINR